MEEISVEEENSEWGLQVFGNKVRVIYFHVHLCRVLLYLMLTYCFEDLDRNLFFRY